MRDVMIRYVILCMFSMGFLFTYVPNTSYACSCVPPGPVSEELARHSAVFSGKVVDMIDENKSLLVQSSADPITVVFEVNESWKGINQTEVIVYTERSSASCGYEFNLNNEYLVYANEVDGELRVSLCSRTAALTEAGQDIQELGIGEEPTKQVSLNVTNNSPFYIYLLVMSIILVGMYVSINKRHKH